MFVEGSMSMSPFPVTVSDNDLFGSSVSPASDSDLHLAVSKRPLVVFSAFLSSG